MSTSLFAVGSSVVFQSVLMVSGLGSAWLIGDSGRGMLAYGAVAGTFCGTVSAGGISSAAAIAVHNSTTENALSLRRYLLEISVKRGVSAGVMALLMVQFARSSISSGFVPIAIGSFFAATGLVQVQMFVGIAQGSDQVNLANATRLISPVVYAVGVVGVALVAGGGTGDRLVGAVAAMWGAGWLAGALFSLKSITTARPPGRLAVDQRAAFKRTERSHFLSSLATYEVLRFDLLAAALFLTTSQLGIYSVSMSFTGLLKAMAASFGIASLGDALHGGEAGIFAPLARRALLVVGAAVVILLLIPVSVRVLLPDEFSDAVLPARLLVVAAGFAAVRRSVVEAGKAAELAYVGSVTEVLQVLIMFPLAALWAKNSSILAGLAAATLGASCIVTCLWTYLVLKRRSAGSARPQRLARRL